jgi:hypothetical protein
LSEWPPNKPKRLNKPSTLTNNTSSNSKPKLIASNTTSKDNSINKSMLWTKTRKTDKRKIDKSRENSHSNHILNPILYKNYEIKNKYLWMETFGQVLWSS